MPVFYNNNQSSNSSAEELKLPGVDVAAGVRRFANKKELYLKSLTKFINELPDAYAPYSEFSKEEAMAESAAYVHTIKGVVGNLALVDLYDKTVITEQHVKNGTLTLENYAEWTDMIKMVKETLLPILLNSQASATVAKTGTVSEFIKLLEEFREPLEFFNSTKCDELLASIKKSKWEGVSGEFISKLSALIDDFEYEDALNEIETFMRNEAN